MRSLFAAEAAPEKKADEKERPDDPNKERSVQVYQARTRNFERRIKSEAHLEESLPWHFEQGAAYHCFSFGDVDALTYLRAVVKQQPLEYVALSTWCMAQTDVDEVRKWVERGLIGHVDFYVGEIFQASYAPIFLQLSELVRITPPMGAWPYSATTQKLLSDSATASILPWLRRQTSTQTRAQSARA